MKTALITIGILIGVLVSTYYFAFYEPRPQAKSKRDTILHGGWINGEYVENIGVRGGWSGVVTIIDKE